MAVRLVMNPAGMAWIWRKAGDFAHTTAKYILRDIIDDIPIDTGEMLRSLRLERTRMVYRPSTRIWVGTDHWAFTEYGVRPHIIRSKKPGKALAIPSRALAIPSRALAIPGVIFDFEVHHPGVKAVAYMRRNLYKKRVIVRWL